MELNKIYCMDVLQGIKQLDTESVDCCVTSPPYWGLRDYGIEGNIWDAQEGCDHQWEEHIRPSNKYDGKPTPGTTGKQSIKGESNFAFVPETKSNFCSKCGCWKGQLGLEPTPELYVKHIVDVFREVKRVLKKSGTAWLNLGDSYSGGGAKTSEGSKQHTNRGAVWEGKDNIALLKNKIQGLKPKDLVGIPWRVAFALQEDGWWLRQDIIWCKGNPMPESITDRCTKAHEYIFLLAKSQTYYFDSYAIHEDTQMYIRNPSNEKYDDKDLDTYHRTKQFVERQMITDGRNKRSVWNINTKPFKDAHFAVFPNELIEPMIKAGTSEKGICPDCGKPWIRITERINESTWAKRKALGATGGAMIEGPRQQVGIVRTGELQALPSRICKTLGWQPTCKCGKNPVHAVVLDPFMGSGTTALVSKYLNRNYIGFDIKQSYVDMANERIRSNPTLGDWI